MWDVIRGLVREGATPLLTTQYLEEADALANSIAVVDSGKTAARSAIPLRTARPDPQDGGCSPRGSAFAGR